MSLETNLRNAITRIATEFKALRTLIGGTGTANITGLTTTNRTSLVAAINEVKAVADAAATPAGLLASANNLSDVANAATALTNLGGVTAATVNTMIQGVVNAAPAALDTLSELASALGNDSNFAATMTTALSNRVRVDASQTFTLPQQAQARTNIAAVASTDIGDTEYNFVTHFEAALA